jgi:hypothetical protein
MHRPRLVVAVLVGALAFYFGLIGYRGVYLLTQPGWVERILGGAVLVLPVIGIWVVAVELRFGHQAQRLTGELGPGEPLDIPRRPSGRVDRDAADLVFDRQRTVVEQDPQDWRGWYRLAEAYDIAGDRRRAREALRTAIERHDAPEDERG